MDVSTEIAIGIINNYLDNELKLDYKLNSRRYKFQRLSISRWVANELLFRLHKNFWFFYTELDSFQPDAIDIIDFFIMELNRLFQIKDSYFIYIALDTAENIKKILKESGYF